jgi:hypothetical protein
MPSKNKYGEDVPDSHGVGSSVFNRRMENKKGDTDSTYDGVNSLHFRPTDEELDVLAEGDLGSEHIDELEKVRAHLPEMPKEMSDSLSWKQQTKRYDNHKDHMQHMRNRDDSAYVAKEDKKKKKKKGMSIQDAMK